ncbi:hypothetical protein DFH28DRAFT_929582 [Melampsora americana]|nr:hypothetical protein DFH28DRAFT_929582 [Melampsora americana]
MSDQETSSAPHSPPHSTSLYPSINSRAPGRKNFNTHVSHSSGSSLRNSKFNSDLDSPRSFILRRTVLLSDGQPPKRTDSQPTWAKFYVQIAGTTISSWDAVEMEIAAKEGRQVAPNYTNITDASVSLPESNSTKSAQDLKAPTPFIFFLNNAGRNKFVFSCSDPRTLLSWVTAIRLAAWERSRLSEIYTGTLLATRPEASQPKEKSEGWLMVRLPGDTEWTRVWCTIIGGDSTGTASSGSMSHKDGKRPKRNSIFGLGGFGGNRLSSISPQPGLSPDNDHEPLLIFSPKKGAKKVLGTMSAVPFIAAMYPESKALIDSSTMFKIEGKFHAHGPDGRPIDQAGVEGFVLATPGEGTVADMLGWLLSIMDAFALYGRPAALNYDLKEPSSFYFGYPMGPDSDRLFLEREWAEDVDINENSLCEIRLALKSILVQRMQSMASPRSQANQAYVSKPISSSAKDIEKSQPGVHKPDAFASCIVLTDLKREADSTPVLDPRLSPGELQGNQQSFSSSKSTGLSPMSSGEASLLIALNIAFASPASPKGRSPVSPQAVSTEHVSPPAASSQTTSPQNSLTLPVHAELTDDIHEFSSYFSIPESTQSPGQTSKPNDTSPSKSQISSPVQESSTKSPDPSPSQSSQQTGSPKTMAVASESEPLEAYDDMLYALSLADDPTMIEKNLASSSSPHQTPLTELSNNSQPDFLNRPPPSRSSPPTITMTEAPKTSFPSSFAAGKKSAARIAAAQAAQAAGKAAIHMPGQQSMRNTMVHQLPSSTHGEQHGHFPNSASRREIPAVLREQPEPVDTTGLRPAFSAHGLLHRVMQEKQERSVQSIQEAAHRSGEPLVQVNHKPPPPQNGLLGAIASHERDRKRDGGMGAALTERVRERKALEGRQREMEEMHRVSMLNGGMGMMGGYPAYGNMMQGGMMPMMYNPSMMGGMGGMGSPPGSGGGYEQMMYHQAHQMQMQQQAMLAAQQAYMSSFSGYPGGPNQMMGGNPNLMGSPSMIGGNLNSHQSMYLSNHPNQTYLNGNQLGNYQVMNGPVVGGGGGGGSVIGQPNPNQSQMNYFGNGGKGNQYQPNENGQSP